MRSADGTKGRPDAMEYTSGRLTTRPSQLKRGPCPVQGTIEMERCSIEYIYHNITVQSWFDTFQVRIMGAVESKLFLPPVLLQPASPAYSYESPASGRYMLVCNPRRNGFPTHARQATCTSSVRNLQIASKQLRYTNSMYETDR